MGTLIFNNLLKSKPFCFLRNIYQKYTNPKPIKMMEIIPNAEMPTNLGGHPEVFESEINMTTPEKKNSSEGDESSPNDQSGSSGSLNS